MPKRQSPSKPAFNPISSLTRWINLGLVLATLLAYLSPVVNPSKTWFFTIIGLGYPFLVLGNFLFIAFWLWRKKIYFLFSLGVILVGFGHFQNLFAWHSIKDSTAKKDEIVVITFNTAGFTGYGTKANSGEQRMAELKKLAALRPHILCLQEVSNLQQIEEIKRVFGFKHHFKSQGTVLFSQFPFIRQEEFNFKSAENGCLWADLETPAGEIRVYNLHLQSNKMTRTATRITTEGDIREKETWKDIRFVLARYKRGAQTRSEQIAIIKAHITQSKVPVFVCGDLNDTPISYVYRQLSENLNDSFAEKGRGLGATFAGKLPALRIDYVLADKRFKIEYHKVLQTELSDHFPVLVRLNP